MLLDERYELIRMVVLFSGKIKVRAQYEKTVIINYAIALKELGEMEKMRKILRRKDLPNSKPHKMAIHILLNEIDKGFQLFPDVIEAVKFDSERKKMMEWPLFKHLRNDKRFINAFKSGFITQE